MMSPAPFTSNGSRRSRCVQVLAKGKGKSAFRRTQAPPGQMPQMGQAPPVPEVDPENEEFVVFVRANSGLSTVPKNWVPLSIVKGGQSANLLVKAMESEWGRKLYGKTLITNIAKAVYQDKDAIIKGIRKSYPPFANVPGKDFEFGFKIRDKADPKSWTSPSDVVAFPSEDVLVDTAIDTFKKFWSVDNILSMFTAPNPTSP